MAANTIREEQIEDPWAYQRHILPYVSRTFALTIPQLPAPLDASVTNAYLLCRIADTIEDDARLSADDKTELHEEFLAALQQRADGQNFARHAAEAAAPETPARERELLAETPKVLAVTHGLSDEHQRVLTRCLTIMCYGMGYYQRNARADGMADLGETDRYCYYVAGVVGEILTELFCLHSRDISSRHRELLELAPSFGEGLQLTNILKDFWDDHNRGACWLPRDVFAKHGVLLDELNATGERPEGFADALHDMVAITHGHLQMALQYTLMIPRRHIGIRRFCLWALGLAVLTLRRIDAQPDYRGGDEVKVSRRALRGTIVLTNLSTRSDTLLRLLFAGATRGLPRQPTGLRADDVSCWGQSWSSNRASPTANRAATGHGHAGNDAGEASMTGLGNQG